MRVERFAQTEAISRDAQSTRRLLASEAPPSVSEGDYRTLYTWSVTPYSSDLRFSYPQGLSSPYPAHCPQSGRHVRDIASDLVESQIPKLERLHIAQADPEVYGVAYRLARMRETLLTDIGRYRRGKLSLDKLMLHNTPAYSFFFGNPAGMPPDDMMIALMTLYEQMQNVGFMNGVLEKYDALATAWNLSEGRPGLQINV